MAHWAAEVSSESCLTLLNGADNVTVATRQTIPSIRYAVQTGAFSMDMCGRWTMCNGARCLGPSHSPIVDLSYDGLNLQTQVSAGQ
jgi:hypothetical protein